MPTSVYSRTLQRAADKAVDLVLGETTSSGAGSDPGEPPAPRDCARPL